MNKRILIHFIKLSNIVVVVFILFAYLIFSLYQINAFRIFEDQGLKTTKNIYVQLEREYYQTIKKISFFKGVIEENYKSGDFEFNSIQKTFNQVNNLDNHINELLVIDKDGNQLFQIFDSKNKPAVIAKPGEPVNLKEHKYFKELENIELKEFYTSEIITKKANDSLNNIHQYTLFGTALRDLDENKIGYLLMSHDFKIFSEIIETHSNNINGNLLLIDIYGNIINNFETESTNSSQDNSNFYTKNLKITPDQFNKQTGYFETQNHLYSFYNFKLNNTTYHLILSKSKKEILNSLLNNFGIIYLICVIIIAGILILLWNYSTIVIKRQNFFTLIKKKNAELVETRIERDRFYMMIAHDLRTPFSGILGLTELLSSRINQLSKEQIVEFSNKIHQSSVHNFKLLNDLLDWCRTQTNTIQAEPKQFNIKELVDEVIIPFNELIERKNLSISIDIDPTVEVYADRNMIETVIRNLLSNALKFTSNDGTILIVTTNESGFCYLNVRDSGCGIPKSRLKTVISSSLVNSTRGTNQEKGTGIGLSLCKNFIELNGGTITVKSKVDIGSCFKISIPLAPLMKIKN